MGLVYVFIPEHKLRPNLLKITKTYLEANSISFIELTRPFLKDFIPQNYYVSVPLVYINCSNFLKYLSLNKNLVIGDFIQIKKALKIAKKVHYGNKRRNGDNYFNGHILPVALQLFLEKALKGKKVKSDLLLTGILHDVLEDGNKKKALKALKSNFSSSICQNILNLTKVSTKDIATLPQYRTMDFKKAKNIETKKYVQKVQSSSICIKVKCTDRLLNLFSDIENKERKNIFVKDYMLETKTFYYPMFKKMSGSCFYLLKLAFGILKDLVLV